MLFLPRPKTWLPWISFSSHSFVLFWMSYGWSPSLVFFRSVSSFALYYCDKHHDQRGIYFGLRFSEEQNPGGSTNEAEIRKIGPGLLALACLVCFLTPPRTTLHWADPIHSGLVLPTSIINVEDTPTNLLRGLSDGSIFSVGVPSSQRTLACVKLTKANHFSSPTGSLLSRTVVHDGLLVLLFVYLLSY